MRSVRRSRSTDARRSPPLALEAPTLAPDIEPQTFFVRVTQALARILQQRNGDGYVGSITLGIRR